MKKFRSDGAREYLSSSMATLLKSHDTISQQSCLHGHQQNGVVEHKNRHILEATRSLLLSTSVPKCYWAEVVLTAALPISITPSSVVVALSPYTHLYGHSFDYPFFLNIAMLIKDIGIMTPLPNVFALPDMCYFLKKFLIIILLSERIFHFLTLAHPWSLPLNLLWYTHFLHHLYTAYHTNFLTH